MLDWFKKRKNDRNKRESLRMGIEAVERINAGVEQWRAERIVLRREMSSNDFDERLVTLSESDGLSYEQVINIDALAFLKNWYEQFDNVMGETKLYLADDDLAIVEMVGGQERFLKMLTDAWTEESNTLQAHVDQSIAWALKHHS